MHRRMGMGGALQQGDFADGTPLLYGLLIKSLGRVPSGLGGGEASGVT